jgi:hypothetical protein
MRAIGAAGAWSRTCGVVVQRVEPEELLGVGFGRVTVAPRDSFGAARPYLGRQPFGGERLRLQGVVPVCPEQRLRCMLRPPVRPSDPAGEAARGQASPPDAEEADYARIVFTTFPATPVNRASSP